MSNSVSEPEEAPKLHKTDLTYLTRKDGLYSSDPDYRVTDTFDVVYCSTCNKTEIEPEVRTCEGCGLRVCPHCAGTAYGYHEVCRQQIDGEIDPLIDRRAYLEGYLAALYNFAWWKNGEMFLGAGLHTFNDEKEWITKRMLPELPE